jgi:acyl carrier protein
LPVAETLERIQSVFRDTFDDDALVLSPAMTADDVEGWDSLMHINLIYAIEQEFKVRFTTAEVTSLKNVGDLITLVEKKQAPKS